MQGLPPAYHDEFSYLFQTKTFLSGRLYFEPHPMAPFFDQMHVLNDDGVFASRYFPGVGLFYAPFVAAGITLAGNYLAVGLSCVLVCLIGFHLGLGFWAVLAALLCALAPPLPVFANLILSHIPTTLGLLLCLWGYLTSVSSCNRLRAALSGIGLGFALLCRPLTAFGFALPLAIHGLVTLIREPSGRRWLWAISGLGPLVAAIVGLGWYNYELTGSVVRTPYGKYLDIYTPRHRYGFYNVSRGERYDNPKVLKNYDAWAEEHTPARALRLAAVRAATVARWTLGLTATAFLIPGACMFLRGAWSLCALAALGVHLAYFPYAFEGIFGLSYVFESAPLVILMLAGALRALICCLSGRGQSIAALAILVFVASNWVRFGIDHESTVVAGGPLEELRAARSQIMFAKRYYADFDRLIRRTVSPPALIIIKPDPTDRHRDLVYNDPTLDGPVLRARDRGPEENTRLMRMYPDREVWFYDAATGRLVKIRDRITPSVHSRRVRIRAEGSSSAADGTR